MKKALCAALLAGATALVAAPPPKATPAPAKAGSSSMSEDDKTVYALGLLISRNLGGFALSEHELEVLKQGITDAAHNAPKVDLEQYGPKVNELAKSRAAVAAAA